MLNAELLTETDTFRTLVVDDDKSVLEDIKACLPETDDIKLDLISEPEEIDNYRASGKTCHMVVLDIRFGEQNKIEYALAGAKKAWPDAIIVILSHYDNELSEGERHTADIILNKAKLIAEPNLLRKRLIKIIPKHRILNNPIAERFLEMVEAVETSKKTSKKKIELHRMRGYVIGREGKYIKVVVPDPPGAHGEGQRRLLLSCDMFGEEGLDEVGTPFILRMYRLGGEYTLKVMLDKEKDKPAVVPKDVEELLIRLEKKEQKLRKEE